MAGFRAGHLAPLLLVVPLLAGCLEPFQARVDAAVLTRDLAWVESVGASQSVGWFGPNSVETDYTFKAGAGPPYPAILQLFSLREAGRRSTQDLLALTHTLVDRGTSAAGIEADTSGARNGTRTLQSGLQTHWFSQEGTVKSTSALFQQQHVRVLIIGEVGYDGESSTSVLAVGIAQVENKQCTPILTTCQTNRNLRSWDSMVGDEAATVRGAKSPNGLIDHLVTHD